MKWYLDSVTNRTSHVLSFQIRSVCALLVLPFLKMVVDSGITVLYAPVIRICVTTKTRSHGRPSNATSVMAQTAKTYHRARSVLEKCAK